MSDRNGHGHRQMRSTLIAPKFSAKKLFFCLLLLFFVFPHTSHEFFEFKGSEDIGHNTADTNKPIAKRPFEKKFKFRKIERIQSEDEVDEEEDEEAKGEENEDDSGSRNDGTKDRADIKRNNKRRNRDNDDDDDNDDDNGKRMKAGAEGVDSGELPFKHARIAHREGRATAAASTTRNEKKRGSAKQQRDNGAGTDNDVDDTDADKSVESKSYGNSIFGSLFGSSKSNVRDNGNSNEKTTSAEDKSTEQKESTNSIIDWLKWLSKRDDSAEEQEVPVSIESAESFLSYLDRWPINSLFPIGKAAKQIPMPRNSHHHHKQQQRRTASAENDDSDEIAAPMSQDNFETLLHTLPSFVPSPAHVLNTECRQQLQIFHRQLRGHKLWTLQMLDATGKITSGMLRGNINQFGDFAQCMQVKTVVKVTPQNPIRIRGKYCLAHIEMETSTKELKVPLHYAKGRGLWRSHFGNPSHFVPRYGIANWGVCIPHLCNGEIVQQVVEANLRSYNTTGVEFHVEVGDDDCYTRTNVKIMRLMKKDRNFALTFLGFCALITLCLSSLITKHNAKIKYVLNFIIIMVRTSLKGKQKENEEKIVESADAVNEPVADESVVDQDAVVTKEFNTEDKPYEKHEGVLHSLTELLKEIINAFSPQRTFIQLLDADHYTTEFPIFNILKLGATFALYVSLKYLMLGHLPITDRDKLVRTLDQPQSIIFRSPMIFMDVLLMISGFLIAYQLAEEMEQKNHIQLLKRMTLKITRFLPTLFVVLFFQTWILPVLDSGPLWSNLIGQNTRLCEEQMWRNFFGVQNCSPMTIQLALEVQLYILGPLIVWLYYTDADAAFFIYGALHAMSVSARYSRTHREHLSMTIFHGMNVSKFYRTANLLFSSPVSRATPYLLGIGTGLLHRSQAGTIEIATELIPVGWFCSILSLFWCFWSPSAGTRTDFVYTAGDAASYAAWCPLIMGLALAWCIFMFPRDGNSILRFLTTIRPVLFLSRITFPIQLMTYVVVLYNTATVSESRKYQLSDLINFNEIGVILASGILLAFLIDVPAQHVRRIIINRLFLEGPVHEHDQDVEPSSGAEASEPEGEAELETDKEDQTNDDVGVIWTTGEEAEDVAGNTKVNAEDEGEDNTIAADGVEDKETEVYEEEEEIKRRPEKGDSAEEAISFTRRRRRISDD
ncbi:O-acyltransferase like protein-like isoform X2 [Eurosta solidaginis]|uniref:O-acyltransferase like protein-like isoform X2 n=1 Tax=Eurosta solidaginis TaxID=178769 RepID=UPI0035310A43